MGETITGAKAGAAVARVDGMFGDNVVGVREGLSIPGIDMTASRMTVSTRLIVH